MIFQLVDIEDLKNILSKLEFEHFLQLQSDGSIKIFIKGDNTSDVLQVINNEIKNRNEERKEIEDIPRNVKPIMDVEFINEEELEYFPHFKEYFTNSQVIPSDVKEQLNSWFNMKTFDGTKHPPIITFYSYKGGVGRSTTMAVVARLLARDGYNIAVLDFDLEAPGQLPLLTEIEFGSRFGVIDYLINKPYLKEQLDKHELKRNYVVEIPNEQNEGSIYLMPAGGINSDDYIERLASINFDYFTRLPKNPLDDLFIDVQNAFNPDYILVDARTGFADIAGTLLFRYSDLVSVHVYNNLQNKLGIRSLIKQMSNMYDNAEQLRIIWTHTAIPKSKLEEGKHEELQSYLTEELKSLYNPKENVNAADIMADNIGKEYWELGSIIHTEKLDGASCDDIKDFVVNQPHEDYVRLKNKIVSLVKTNNEIDVQLTALDKRKIISEIKYGEFIAEEDDYKTFEDFQKNFLLIDGMEELLNIKTHLIIGAKGTGKSALFRVMREYEKELIHKLNLHEKNVVMTDILANPDYYKNKNFVSFDDLQELNRMRKNSDINEMLYWKRFWKLYLWMQIYQEYTTDNEKVPKILLEALVIAKVPEWMKEITYNYNTLSKMHVYLIERKFMDDVTEWFNRVDGILLENDIYLSCLYDHLDKLFETEVELPNVVISALLSFWDDGEFVRIIPKILLRKDIYNRLNIQNKSHWITRYREIKWTQNDLNRLILKRTIAHSPTLIQYIEKNSEEYLRDKKKFEYKLGIEIPREEALVEKMINLIFGVRMGAGKKSGTMKNWFYNHLRDANDTVYPRDAIHLLKLVKEKIEGDFDKYFEEDRIISGKAITDNDTYGQVSERRYMDLKEEYRYLESFFEEFKKCSFTFSKLSKSDIIEKILDNNRETSVKEIEYNINTLIEIGVLKKYKNDNIAMPDLYLNGFNAKRPGPI